MRRASSAVAVGRAGDLASFDIRLDASAALETRHRELSGVGTSSSRRFRRDGDIARVDARARDEADDGDGHRAHALAVVADASAREGGRAGTWMMAGGRGTATATRDAPRPGPPRRGVGSTLRATAEVELGGVCLEVDVREGSRGQGRERTADVAEACARWRDGAALWRFESNVVERAETKAKAKAKAKAGRDRFEVALDVIEIARVDEGAGYGELAAIRIHPTMVGECAFVSAHGEVATMTADGVKRVPWRPSGSEMTAVGDWYGLGYGAHPRTLLHGSHVGSTGISSVHEVDLRTRRGETRRAHEADRGETLCAISTAFEHYYAVATRESTSESSNVELRDVRRANDPVLRWDHQGLVPPTTLRIVDVAEWCSKCRSIVIQAFTPGTREVYLYECERFVGERRGHSGEQVRAVTFGSTIPLPSSSGVHGFAMTKLGVDRGGMFWRDEDGVWCQNYAINGDVDAMRFQPPQFSEEDAARHAGETVDFLSRNPVPLSRWQQKRAPDDAFIDLPHLHEFIANGVVPVSDFPVDDSLERDPDGERETVARLHAAFTDGWRMNASELLECAEYLQGTSRASASMRIDEWRNRFRTRSEPAPNYAEFIDIALSKPLTTATPLDDERTREIIERDLPKWKKIFAENSLPQPLEMALRDYRLARYRDADEIQHTKFARRLFHASRCLNETQDEDFDGASASTAKNASQASTTLSQIGDDAPFADRLLSQWTDDAGGSHRMQSPSRFIVSNTQEI